MPRLMQQPHATPYAIHTRYEQQATPRQHTPAATRRRQMNIFAMKSTPPRFVGMHNKIQGSEGESVIARDFAVRQQYARATPRRVCRAARARRARYRMRRWRARFRCRYAIDDARRGRDRAGEEEIKCFPPSPCRRLRRHASAPSTRRRVQKEVGRGTPCARSARARARVQCVCACALPVCLGGGRWQGGGVVG